MLKYVSAFFILFLTFPAFSSTRYIHVNANVVMRTAPFYQSNQAITTLRPSTELVYEVLEELPRALKIRTPDGQEGYIARGARDHFTTPAEAPVQTVSPIDPSETGTAPAPEVQTSTVTVPTPRPDDAPAVVTETTTVDVPEGTQLYCKHETRDIYYYERECERRGLTANYCRDNRFGYHVCGTDPSRFTNLTTEDQVNGTSVDTGNRRSGERGSCAPNIYVGWPLVDPVLGNRLFGRQRHPILGYVRMHNGWDFPGSRNNHEIRASAPGTVSCHWSAGYGYYVKVNHGQGLSTRYAHLRSRLKCGQTVNRGDQIGVMGSTGLSTGTHLHYEVRCNNTPVDPQNYVGIPVDGDSGEGTVATTN
ncbi:MAG: peptidoglycan DD-metalloendopeptidase family protein [Bdellovibrionales bacterium]|nr:peptidoglycan DD-metalloendopeptidase family protein [Bdellovibrionales bacterium]NQZ17735.1 peptidoglycan DD-metalloendopeptidase family protein [Bdellovibrionales bacterium]